MQYPGYELIVKLTLQCLEYYFIVNYEKKRMVMIYSKFCFIRVIGTTS